MEQAVLEHHLRDDLRGALRDVVPVEAGLVEGDDVRYSYLGSVQA
jgi:hypothetical protein